MELDLDRLIRLILEIMAEEERPTDEEAARIFGRVFSDCGKEEEDQ